MSFLVSNARSVPISSALLAIVLTLFLGSGAWCQDSLSQRSPEDLLNLARQARSQEQFGNSILYYRSYLSVHPQDDDVLNELARTYSWNAEYDSALANYGIVLSRNQNNFDAQFGRCQVLAWKKQFAEAMQEADRLIGLYPRSIDLLLLAANIRMATGEFGQAVDVYQRILTMESDNLDARIGRCRALYNEGNGEQAYDEAVALYREYPETETVEELYQSVVPKPRNQIFVRYQNESFDVAGRTDHNTFQVQYYRMLSGQLTAYLEGDAFHRFDQNDRSFGAGAYYSFGFRQSLYGYCLVTPNPKVTSSVDASIEYSRFLSGFFSASVAYRLINFTTETAHVVSPSLSWSFPGSIELTPRVFISRTVKAKATSTALGISFSYNRGGLFTPYVYYAVGNEAYRGVTLDNVESSASWSISVGGKFALASSVDLRADYQYINRIAVFHENSLDMSLGVHW